MRDNAKSTLLADQLEVLGELDLIAKALDAIEQQYGSHELIDAARCRQERVCADALAQLGQLVPCGPTVH
jgi:hypothetical protein